MNYNPTTRILTIDNYYDLVKFARKQDWEFNCNHPKKIIIDVYDVLDPVSPKDVDNLMDKKVYTQVECFEVTHPMNRSLKTIDGILYTKDGKAAGCRHQKCKAKKFLFFVLFFILYMNEGKLLTFVCWPYIYAAVTIK